MSESQWRPFSEMPDDMTSAFLHKHSWPHWQIASKGTDGKWRIAFGLIKAEVKDPETYYFLPLSIIPPLPDRSS